MYANQPVLPGPTYTGRPVNAERIADTILAAIDAGECGATIGSTGRPYGGDGILVALDSTHNLELIGEWRAPALRRLVTRWVEQVARDVTVASTPRRYFGAWIDQGTLYLDVVEAFSSAEEREAIFAGLDRHQRSIYHAGRRQCIPLVSDAQAAA